jgi:hypothetical protein
VCKRTGDIKNSSEQIKFSMTGMSVLFELETVLAPGSRRLLAAEAYALDNNLAAAGSNCFLSNSFVSVSSKKNQCCM